MEGSGNVSVEKVSTGDSSYYRVAVSNATGGYMIPLTESQYLELEDYFNKILSAEKLPVKAVYASSGICPSCGQSCEGE